jgi:signal transduction histidine kinase
LQLRDLDALAREASQPIDALGLRTRALRRRTTDAESEEVIAEIDLGLRQMRRQLGSLLDLIRIDYCLRAARHTEFALLPLFEKAILQTERLAYENRVWISAVPTALHVVSNPGAVELIVRNLLVNAVFYARGSRALLGCRRRSDSVLVQILYNGVGISPKHQRLIFEPLRKLKGDDDAVQGLGLSLAIARQLAEALRHALDLRSTPSRGSVFSLTLPLATRSAAVISREQSSVS